MSVGDGVVWNEALPDNNTVANQIDDYNRDLRVGVRSRMALEHIWPSSQTATGQAGMHNFITLQTQTAQPSIGTAAGGLCIGSSAAGYPLLFINSASTSITLVNSAGTLPLVTTGTQGSIPICSSASPNTLTVLAASAPGMTLHTNTNTAAPTWAKIDLADASQITAPFISTYGAVGEIAIAGFGLKWGATTPGNPDSAIVFAHAFTNTCYSVLVTKAASGDYGNNFYAAAVTKTGFNCGGYGNPVFWMAAGY